MKNVIDVFKVLWLALWAILVTIVLFIPITLAATFSSTGNLAFNLSKLWAWALLIATRVRTRIVGKEKIKKGQTYIIISNHQSQFDILALVTRLGIQFRWIIKKELLKIPLFGYALLASRNIFIDRSNTKESIESINRGMKRLPKGTSIMVFAEGTRSPDGKIHPFKKGGFVLAIDYGLPILPITINGSRKVLPKGSVVFTPGEIDVIVGDPIDTKGYTRESLPELMERTRQVIVSSFKPPLNS
ncbi:MAG: 1-acyl-sn-glycerol-3-phosphate acyltransferase [Deltaproteobacteria bacterium]|nr:1-acyl-sn-glycerol-3-phosphate acyltransferase [Deltaproteobacteria bacterium]